MLRVSNNTTTKCAIMKIETATTTTTTPRNSAYLRLKAPQLYTLAYLRRVLFLSSLTSPTVDLTRLTPKIA